MIHPLQPDLIAPCGMNCALCWAYQAQLYDLKAKGFNRQYCPGCIQRGEHCTHMRNACETIGKGNVRFCFECEGFPCDRLKRLDKRYRTKYHMSMIANLRQIQAQGMDAFLKDQETKWRCLKCGEHLVCCHCGLCIPCDLELLRKNRNYRWGENELNIE
jgi:ribosomal protein L37E